jgi:hypothetical protein
MHLILQKYVHKNNVFVQISHLSDKVTCKQTSAGTSSPKVMQLEQITIFPLIPSPFTANPIPAVFKGYKLL